MDLEEIGASSSMIWYFLQKVECITVLLGGPNIANIVVAVSKSETRNDDGT